MHLNEENIIFEKQWLDKEQRHFVPIITDLIRETQPIVRYRLNDVLKVSQTPCPCGKIQMAIESISGREDQVLYFQDIASRRLIPVFPDFIRRAILQASSKIEDYKVVQISPIELEVQVNDIQDEAKLKAIKCSITELLDNKALVKPYIAFKSIKTQSISQKRLRVSREFHHNDQRY